jgi:autotransporter-associated beta strand protein
VLQGGSLNAGVLTKTGAGTLELTVSNTFTSVSATSGAIQIGANGSLGSNGVGLDGSQLTTSSAVTTVANAINVSSGGATLSVGGTAAFTGVINTVSAAANTSYALTKAGAGALTIDKTLGTQMTKNTSGGAFTLGVTDGSLTLSGATQKNLGGAMTWDGSVSVTVGRPASSPARPRPQCRTSHSIAATAIQARLNYGRSSIANRTVVNSPVTLVASAGASLEMTGTMSGSGGVTTTPSSSAQVRLKGVASTLSGTLAIGGSGTTEVYSAALGSLTPGISAGATLRFINLVDGTFAGPIAGAGAVVISCASAKQTLSGANTYAGATTVEAGTLVINGTNSGAGATERV